MKSTAKISIISTILFFITSPLYAVTMVGTETVLDRFFSVNLHMDNCCDGDYANTYKVIDELKYIGARRARDWATNDSVIMKWKDINSATGIKFHVSIPQTSPKGQREALDRIENWLKKHPEIIDVIEGSNEPDTEYPASKGASLEDSAILQNDVYKVGKKYGVNVAQLSVGGGWAPPFWEGNYKKFGTPPADFGNAHVYMNAGEPPSISLERIGELARYSVGDKPVDVTEFGTYQKNQDDKTASAFMHLAPFDAYLMGYVGLSVYALHDDMSGIVGFYRKDGTKRAIADYWHHTTKLLSDSKGKELAPKEINISFENQKMANKPPLGIKNVVMYKSDGSVWIATFYEERIGSEDGFQTIIFDKKYSSVKIFDARNADIIKEYNEIDRVDITLPINQLYLIKLSN